MSTLYASYEGQLIGTIESDAEERLSFHYDSHWLESAEKFALSFALPLRSEPYGHVQTRAFFENLLPEGQVRRRIEARSRIEQDSDFAFLRRYGRDCAGAISIHENWPSEHGKKEDAVGESGLVALEFAEIYDALDARRHIAEVIADREYAYLSLAGAQDKFPATVKDGKIYLSDDDSPTTHIVKTPILTYKSTADSVYNEYFCMKLASRVGFEIPQISIIEGKYPLYIIERFDRRVDSQRQKTIRIHQQDFCQAQGIASSRKYETQGGPSFSDNYAVLRRNSTNKIEDLRTLMRWVCFNLIIGNNDSHSKNLSLLHHASGCRLAPLYDLISTAIYPEIQNLFAFRIGESNRWEALRSSHFHEVEKQLKVRKGVFLGLMHAMCEQIETLAPAWVEEFGVEFPQVKTARKISREIHKRIRHFRHQGI